MNAATWAAEVESWGADPDPEFLAVHPHGATVKSTTEVGEQPPADRFRQGRRNGELIYRQAGPGPSGADELVVVVPRDPDLAERIVGLLNREVSGA